MSVQHGSAAIRSAGFGLVGFRVVIKVAIHLAEEFGYFWQPMARRMVGADGTATPLPQSTTIFMAAPAGCRPMRCGTPAITALWRLPPPAQGPALKFHHAAQRLDLIAVDGAPSTILKPL